MMDNVFDFNAGEWGDIIYEESSTNRRLRASPARNVGYSYIACGVLDLLLVGILVYFTVFTDQLAEDSPTLVLYVLILVMCIIGIGTIAYGAQKLKFQVKPYIMLEKGIVEDKFVPFEETPIIELRGSKGKGVIFTRKGETSSKKVNPRVLNALEELDFLQFSEVLKAHGYGAEEKPPDVPTTDAPKDDKKADAPKDAPSTDAKKDGDKGEDKK